MNILHFYGENGKIVYNLMTDERNLDDFQISADALLDTIYLRWKIHLRKMLSESLFESHPNVFFSIPLAPSLSLRYDGILWLY